MNIDSLQLEEGPIIEYTETGNGNEVYIFLHGLGSSLRAFDKIIPEMEKGTKCIALNFPKEMSNFSLISYAEQVAAFIEVKKLNSPTIVGHSMGGQVALHLALKFPESIGGLVLIAPAGIETFSEEDKSWFSKYLTKDFYKAMSPDRVKYNFDINFSGGKLPEDAEFMFEERAEIMSDSVKYDAYLDYYLGCVHAMLREPVFGNLEDIKHPTLIIFGTDDRLIPNRILHPGMTTEDVLKAVNGAIEYSSTAYLDDCGHFAVWDKPSEIAKLITNFN